MQCITNTSNLTCRCHFYSKFWICSPKPMKWKLGCLDTNIVHIKCIIITRNIDSHNGPCCHIYEVVSGYFWYKWKTPRSPNIAFDYLYRIIFCKKLYIKWSSDIEFSNYAFWDTFDFANSFDIDFLCRQYYCSISRMNTGILNMLSDSIDFEFPILPYSIYLYFFGSKFKFWNNRWMFYRYFCYTCEKSGKLSLIWTYTHICPRENIGGPNDYWIPVFFCKIKSLI